MKTIRSVASSPIGRTIPAEPPVSIRAFDNVNFGQPQNYLGSSATGQITSAGNPRILQFALKLSF
jgi:hypothetical protein